jgi:hypothetical protein
MIFASEPRSNLHGNSCDASLSSLGRRSDGVPENASLELNSKEDPSACPDALIFSSWHRMTRGNTCVLR